MAFCTVVFLVLKRPFVPVGTGDIFGLEAVFTIGTSKCDRLSADYLECGLDIFYFAFLY